LLACAAGRAATLLQFQMARAVVQPRLGQSAHVTQLLMGDDRLLLTLDSEDGNLQVRHLLVPQSYIASNWPVRHVACSEDGADIAVAGSTGICLYNRRSQKWRVFGDVSQERKVKAEAMVWLPKIVGVCSRPEGGGGAVELAFYPRYHLDASSVLARMPLPARPIALDAQGEYLLIALAPPGGTLELRVIHVSIRGELSPLGKPALVMTPVRELSIMSARMPPVAMSFVPYCPPRPRGGASPGSKEEDPAFASSPITVSPLSPRHGSLPAPLAPPTRCMLLRLVSHQPSISISHTPRPVFILVKPVITGLSFGCSGLFRDVPLSPPSPPQDGELSLLDLERGCERALAAGVESFWLTSADPRKGGGEEELPWWAYGRNGMQVWYPSSLATAGSPGGAAPQLDPELEFDREVFPLGICPTSGTIIGVTQHLAFHPSVPLPCFEPTAKAQPVLPCLLRHLLSKGHIPEAVHLATQAAGRKYFASSLEWLLFTVCDANASAVAERRRAAREQQQGAAAPAGARLEAAESGVKAAEALLGEVISLIRRFPDYLDVVRRP